MIVVSKRGLLTLFKYAAILGVLAAFMAYLGGIASLSDNHEQKIIKIAQENEKILDAIGEVSGVRVKKYLQYSGTGKDVPYYKYVIAVHGKDGSVLVDAKITSPNEKTESISVSIRK